MLHRLHGNGAVQRQRAGDNAARHAPLGNLRSGNGAGHLLGNILHSGQNSHLGAVDAQCLCHRQGVFHDPDLRLHVGVNVDGGICDHHKAPLILKNTALAHQPASALGDQSRFAVQNSAGKIGGLQDPLHGNVCLTLFHQLDGDLGGFQLLPIKVNDLVLLLVFAHVVEHMDDLILFADERTFHHASALSVDHGAQSRLIVCIGQRNALFHILRKNIGFNFLKRCKHDFSSLYAGLV